MKSIVKMMTMSFPSRYSPRAYRLSEGFTLSDYVPIGKDLGLVSSVLYSLLQCTNYILVIQTLSLSPLLERLKAEVVEL